MMRILSSTPTATVFRLSLAVFQLLLCWNCQLDCSPKWEAASAAVVKVKVKAHSAIQLYSMHSGISHLLRKDLSFEKGVKPVAAELPGESSEQVIAVVERDSALWASGCTEDPVEEFIYESDEDAPGPS
nr:uncharacterized protein LOC101137834 isoform X1 [Gorilla gorilla gorilla]XP_055242447.1 uncharacterized protein LOC101137834 isoform X1 [Gorilla gorilla gorilla]